MTVTAVGILGAGTMGAGIAQVASLGGFETIVYDPDPEALERGQELIGAALAKGVERDRWSLAEGDEAVELLSGTTDLGDFADCDLVVEAAPEILDLKRDLFAAVAAVCDPETVLATNTSSLQVAEIAVGVPHPERVVGMHFFNPPVLMKLVEVVAAERSSEAALATTTAVAEQMRRIPIRAKDSPGFVANRLARPFSLESLRMLGDGVADAETIDRVARLGGGFRMGPFELIDLIGLDVNLTIARSFFAQGGELGALAPEPDPGTAGRGRQARPQERPGLLRLRRWDRARDRPRARHPRPHPRSREAEPDRPRRERGAGPALRPDRK